VKYTLTAYRRYSNTTEEFEVAEYPDLVFGVSGDFEANWVYRKDTQIVAEDIQQGWSNWGPYWEQDPYIFQQSPLVLELMGPEEDNDPDHPFMVLPDGMSQDLSWDLLPAPIRNAIEGDDD